MKTTSHVRPDDVSHTPTPEVQGEEKDTIEIEHYKRMDDMLKQCGFTMEDRGVICGIAWGVYISLAQSQKREVERECVLTINSFISTTDDGEEYLSPKDLKNVLARLQALT